VEHKEYKLLKDRERFFWWNVGKRCILRDALKRHIDTKSSSEREILDVGCGPGGNMLFLKEFGNVVGLDSSNEALKYAREEAYKNLVLGFVEELPFSNDSFDIVTALDVIEHIENDTQALKEIFKVLKPGGLLLLTVPAHKWLWSRHDEALHHKRRYTDRELKNKIEEAGFEIQNKSHFVVPAIPFLLFQKLVRYVEKILLPHKKDKIDTYDVILPSFLNSLLIAWLSVERFIMRIVPIPFGSSLLVIAISNPYKRRR